MNEFYPFLGTLWGVAYISERLDVFIVAYLCFRQCRLARTGKGDTLLCALSVDTGPRFVLYSKVGVVKMALFAKEGEVSRL